MKYIDYVLAASRQAGPIALVERMRTRAARAAQLQKLSGSGLVRDLGSCLAVRRSE